MTKIERSATTTKQNHDIGIAIEKSPDIVLKDDNDYAAVVAEFTASYKGPDARNDDYDLLKELAELKINIEAPLQLRLSAAGLAEGIKQSRISDGYLIAAGFDRLWLPHIPEFEALSWDLCDHCDCAFAGGECCAECGIHAVRAALMHCAQNVLLTDVSEHL